MSKNYINALPKEGKYLKRKSVIEKVPVKKKMKIQLRNKDQYRLLTERQILEYISQ